MSDPKRWSFSNGDYTEMKQQNENGSKRIEIEISRDRRHIVKKAFTGRILADLDEGICGDRSTRYLVAITKGGNFAVYGQNSRTGRSWLTVYDSFDDVRDNNGADWELPAEVIAAVAAEVGEPYVVELDI